VLPVALPVVPPVAPAALPLFGLAAFGSVELEPVELDPAAEPLCPEVEGDEVLGAIGVLEAGLCDEVEGVTLCVPCEDVLVWSVLLVVLVLPVWLAALLGFCVSTLVWL